MARSPARPISKAQELFVELMNFDPETYDDDPDDEDLLEKAIDFTERADFWHQPEWTTVRIRSYLRLFAAKFHDRLYDSTGEIIHDSFRDSVRMALVHGEITLARQLADEFQFGPADWEALYYQFATNPSHSCGGCGSYSMEHLPKIRDFFLELKLGSLYHDVNFLTALADHISQLDQLDAFDMLVEIHFSTESFFLEIARAACSPDADCLMGLEHMQAYFDPARE